MTFLVLFCLLLVVAVGSNFKVWLYLFLVNSDWYKGAAVLKISSFADILDSRLFIDNGMFRRMDGGWLDSL